MGQKHDADDNETILIALDQISQTIEVMTRVVDRLRHHLQEQTNTKNEQISTGDSKNQTLH